MTNTPRFVALFKTYAIRRVATSVRRCYITEGVKKADSLVVLFTYIGGVLLLIYVPG